MSKNAEVDLKMALMGTGVVQPVSSKCRGGKLEVMCRQLPGQDKAWVQAIREVLVAASAMENPPELHLCRRYVLKDGEVAFGWHFEILASSSKSLDEAVKVVSAKLLDVKPVESAAEKPTEPAPYRRPLPPGQHPSAQGRKIAPGPPGRADTGGEIAIVVTENRLDENGRQYVVREMPLPHVRGEMNRPNNLGRGAKMFSGR